MYDEFLKARNIESGQYINYEEFKHGASWAYLYILSNDHQFALHRVLTAKQKELEEQRDKLVKALEWYAKDAAPLNQVAKKALKEYYKGQ